ncbi:MAG: chemotaxis protein CheA, partial [Burkholderiales bacterium PBB5]
LLEGRDQMGALLEEVRTGDTSPDVAARSLALGEHLRKLYGGAPAPAAPEPAAAAAPLAATTGKGAWHLSLRFGIDALRNGLDPLAFIRYLATLGKVNACHVMADALPTLEALDAEACHLGFELRLLTEAGQDESERVFEFAADDCSVQILPPDADGDAFEQLLALRCEDDTDAYEALLDVWARL